MKSPIRIHAVLPFDAPMKLDPEQVEALCAAVQNVLDHVPFPVEISCTVPELVNAMLDAPTTGARITAGDFSLDLSVEYDASKLMKEEFNAFVMSIIGEATQLGMSVAMSQLASEDE